MTIITTVTKGLLLLINKALKGENPIIGLGENSKARVALVDLAIIFTLLATLPTHKKELIAKYDHYYGDCDA